MGLGLDIEAAMLLAGEMPELAEIASELADVAHGWLEPELADLERNERTRADHAQRYETLLPLLRAAVKRAGEIDAHLTGRELPRDRSGAEIAAALDALEEAARVSRALRLALDALGDVAKLDMTPILRPDVRRLSDNEPPPPGERWPTPRERASAAIAAVAQTLDGPTTHAE
jgi:hypothetical protein